MLLVKDVCSYLDQLGFFPGDVVWPTIAERDCNGTRQSPIDIVTANILPDANLMSFKFTGYDDDTTLYEIENLGYTSKWV